ncbi:hypothetical protein ES703_76922 [subsurface metagenome]
MKNIKFLLFIVCLVFSLNVIFFNCSFATLYILKDQEGKDIWITNNENLVSKYEKLGYIIWILEARGLSQKSLEPESIPNEAQSQLEPESIDSEPQTRVVLPPTTELMPAPVVKTETKTSETQEYKYTASKDSEVFHYITCSYVSKIKPENLILFKTREEAIDSGRRACKICKP